VGARFNYTFLTLKEQDNETNLDYFLARYYSSTQGRFTSVDPENHQAMLDPTDPQSWNAYSYVSNNPLGRVDPDGKGFFSKLKNWLVWNVWGEEEDVKKEEQKRRDMMLQTQKENGGELIIQSPVSGDWVRVDPATMNRANVWLWSGAIYSSPGSRELTPQEAAGVIDATRMGSPALRGDPYSPEAVENRVRPQYRSNPAHDPKSRLFNPRKTPEPADAASVYQSSVRGGMGTWYGKGANGQIYRYFSDNAGGVHFSGAVPKSQVPKAVLRQLGF